MIINLLLQLTNIIDLHGDHHGDKGASWRAFLPPRTKLGVRWQARSFSPLPNNAHLTWFAFENPHLTWSALKTKSKMSLLAGPWTGSWNPFLMPLSEWPALWSFSLCQAIMNLQTIMIRKFQTRYSGMVPRWYSTGGTPQLTVYWESSHPGTTGVWMQFPCLSCWSSSPFWEEAKLKNSYLKVWPRYEVSEDRLQTDWPKQSHWSFCKQVGEI